MEILTQLLNGILAETSFLIKFAACLFCGALFGIERRSRKKPVDIKTAVLIATGAMLFTEVSITAPGQLVDQSRVMAQIVSGIGFLGGGVIIIKRDMVVGLTTAATIWVLASIGMLIGVGRIQIAVFSTIILVMLLTFEGTLKKRDPDNKSRTEKDKSEKD